MIKKFKIPTILGILLLFAGVFAGVFLLKNNQIFKIGASSNITPRDVRISSISDTSVTISWVTSDPTTAFVLYGTTQETNTPIYETEGSQKYFTHSITITGLSPESNYYFKINSDGTNIDNNGIPWQFSTGKELNTGQASIPISGSVITADGIPAKRAIIYVTINGYTLSTITSDSGTFVLQLGAARTPDLSSYAQIDSTKTLLDISATTETGETATAKVFPQSADPIPPLVVGQDQDFRSLGPSKSGSNPNVDLNLPEGATAESKLNVSGAGAGSTTTKTVTLDSVTEGEVVTSDKPQFFGDGPIGEKITITVHSETPITGTTTVSKSGSWSWAPPSGLAPGAHTITISWIDTSGITRTLTRNFIVQAGELPAFVASPSATPTQSPVPVTTPAPTQTPVPTKSPTPLPTTISKTTPTPTPKPTGSATPAALPQSGSLTPTILLFMMGIGILAFSFYVWKISKE